MWVSIFFISLIVGFAALLGYASVNIKYDDKEKKSDNATSTRTEGE